MSAPGAPGSDYNSRFDRLYTRYAAQLENPTVHLENLSDKQLTLLRKVIDHQKAPETKLTLEEHEVKILDYLEKLIPAPHDYTNDFVIIYGGFLEQMENPTLASDNSTVFSLDNLTDKQYALLKKVINHHQTKELPILDKDEIKLLDHLKQVFPKKPAMEVHEFIEAWDANPDQSVRPRLTRERQHEFTDRSEITYDQEKEKLLAAREAERQALLKPRAKGMESVNQVLPFREEIKPNMGKTETSAVKTKDIYKDLFIAKEAPLTDIKNTKAEGGFLKNVGAGIFGNKRGSQLQVIHWEKGELSKAFNKADQRESNRKSGVINIGPAVNVQQDLDQHIERIEDGFNKLEKDFKPNAKPQNAAQHAHDLREHARFIQEQKIPALALKRFYKEEEGGKRTPFHAEVRAKLDTGLPLKKAIESVLTERGGVEKAGLQEELASARQLEDKAIESAKLAVKKNDKQTDAHLIIANLNQKRMLQAAKGLEESPDNEELRKDFRVYGNAAVEAYKKAGGPEGFKELYNLFMMGSEEAGKAAAGLIQTVMPLTSEDRVRLRILRDADFKEAKDFIAGQEDLDKDIILTEKVIGVTNDEINEQVALYKENQNRWQE